MNHEIKIINRKDSDKADWEYWQSKSHEERLEALELLRQQYMEANNVPQRLQRVCRIIKRK